jgi:hypothetical protein
MIPKLLIILGSLIGIDIILTILCVGFFGASEINPLCFNFTYFILVKTFVSIIGIIILYNLRNIFYWNIFLKINIIIYSGLLIFNLYGIFMIL